MREVKLKLAVITPKAEALVKFSEQKAEFVSLFNNNQSVKMYIMRDGELTGEEVNYTEI
jgi:hypothetical protein